MWHLGQHGLFGEQCVEVRSSVWRRERRGEQGGEQCGWLLSAASDTRKPRAASRTAAVRSREL